MSIKKKSIIITTIFPPTAAIKEFAKFKDCHVIVVGDKKTPTDWSCDNVDFLSVNGQDSTGFDIVNKIPYNHYSRKMIGYLKAVQNGAEYIIDTDDDNIPKRNWSFPLFEENYNCIAENKGFINIYQLFTSQKIWPRGLPLNLISVQFDLQNNLCLKKCKVGVWQGLADEDPDVDAIYRLTTDSPCYFEEHDPVVLGRGTISPYNSQNTITRRELFALLYLPSYVTFRFTDILRSLIAQPIMWLYNYQLGFLNATVVQKRNPHNYMKDFLSEIPMYEHCDSIVEIVMKSISANESIEENLYNSYTSLLKSHIINENEMITLESWLKDLEKINREFK